MNWFVIALGAGGMGGAISILEKLALYRYVTFPQTLPFLVGMVQLVTGLILITTLPGPVHWTSNAVLLMMLSGAIIGASAVLFFRSLRTQEVSRAVPINLTAPIFVALIAATVLKEDLSIFHWAAIFATVGGAMLLSFRQDSTLKRIRFHKTFLALIAASILNAVAEVIAKIALDDLSVLQAYALRTIGIGCVLASMSARQNSIKESLQMLKSPNPTLLVITIHSILIITYMICSLWALSLGPVSMVSTILSTRIFWVIVYGTIITAKLGDILGENIAPGKLGVKLVSGLMIMAGVSVIALLH